MTGFREIVLNAGTLISGDKNNLDEKKILALDPKLTQIVSRNTRKNKILSIIITDLQSYFHEPEIIPPVPVDVQGKGVPSDHNGVFALPISSSNSLRTTVARKIEVRPMPESLMSKFGQILANETWDILEPQMSSTELVEKFEQHTSQLVNSVFPLKTVTVSDRDKPYMTEELKTLRRQRQRAYTNGGRSQKYLDIKSRFDLKLKDEANKYQEKVKAEVTEGKRSSSYAALRKLGVGGNDVGKNSFTLPSHADNDLSPQQSADIFADYFSAISQEFDPICVSEFPPNIQQKLQDGKSDR